MLSRLFAVLVTLCVALPAWADAVTDQTLLVAKAANTVERLRRESGLQRDLEARLAHARAVLIIPDLVKGGFILGAEWGTGVLLTRDGAGQWSGPAFYSVASGSVGLQIGVQDAETIFVIMSDAGLRAIMENRFKAGADAGIAIAHIGAGAEAATTTNAGADIYAFNKAMGAYGGASLEGSGILPRHSWNAAYYGGNPSPADIVIARQLDNNQANRLKDLLAR
ncbi:lipid-binding SYLF domain-containing protein [Magnetospirillum sulfuroxidans]|uniref:Lipid-binding SYLF domain-containing protein n=1 Tax=Magnetospirillum sulfuroxidans TaxID=611300 RepID=A0ABS5IDS6_9PROT|nr:lipid-binding SYLF domain-containing protein [Magnetospirillum sulfuroxidans]MBR9972584.1 lipid-binding SYLF domain-containing protein [Magnetospirillum sulfuroxidans]